MYPKGTPTFVGFTPRNVAPVFNVKDYGATGDGSTNDRAAIQAALDAAETAGGNVVYLPAGTYVITTSPLVLAAGIRLEGAGSASTVIRQTTAATAALQLNTERCSAARLQVEVPSLGAGNAVLLSGTGAKLNDVRVIGPTGQTGALVYSKNAFEMHLNDVYLEARGGHGLLLDSDNATSFNYGDGLITNLWVEARANDTVCVEIHGETYVGNTDKVWNNMCFINPVFTASTGLTGVVGMRLVNAQRNTFWHPNWEQMNTALDIQSQVGGGNSSTFNLFVGGYYRDNITIDAASTDNTIKDASIAGTVTDSGSRNRINRPVESHLELRGRFTTQQMTIQLRNQTGATLPVGTIVKSHPSIEGAVTTLATGGDEDEWLAIAAAAVPSLSNGQFAIAGAVDVLVSNACAVGEYVVVDTNVSNAGKGLSVAKVYPSTPGLLVGRCIKAASAGALARVVLARA